MVATPRIKTDGSKTGPSVWFNLYVFSHLGNGEARRLNLRFLAGEGGDPGIGIVENDLDDAIRHDLLFRDSFGTF